MDIRKVKKLIELLEQSQVSEIEIKEGEESVRISRHAAAPASAPPAMWLTPESKMAGSEGAATVSPAETESADSSGHTVRSPMVGVYYASPKPETPPFVEEGQSVVKGDPLCIIEAMKVMNHIEAPIAGTVRKILVKNGEPVQYDEALFVID